MSSSQDRNVFQPGRKCLPARTEMSSSQDKNVPSQDRNVLQPGQKCLRARTRPSFFLRVLITNEPIFRVKSFGERFSVEEFSAETFSAGIFRQKFSGTTFLDGRRMAVCGILSGEIAACGISLVRSALCKRVDLSSRS